MTKRRVGKRTASEMSTPDAERKEEQVLLEVAAIMMAMLHGDVDDTPAMRATAAPWFELHHLWFLSVASVGAQALLSLWLLSRTMRRKLTTQEEAAVD